MLTSAVGKPSALAAAATGTSAVSRPNKSTDGKVHDGALPSDNVVKTGSSSDEEATKAKSKSRSRSRKRTSIFGALLAKKEEHDDKKEIRKEEKVEEKAIKQEEKLETKAANDETSLGKEPKKDTITETKEGDNVGAAPLDASAVGRLIINSYRSGMFC